MNISHKHYRILAIAIFLLFAFPAFSESDADNYGLLYSKGMNRFLLQKYDEAIVYWEQALPLAIKEGNQYMVVFILKALGDSWLILENFQEAIGYFEKMVPYTRGIQLEYYDNQAIDSLFKAYHAVLKKYFYNEKYDMAMDYLERLKDFFEEYKIEKGTAYISFYMGMIYEVWGKLDYALKYKKVAQDIAEKIKDPVFLSECLINTAVLYEYAGKYKTALDNYGQAMAIVEKQEGSEIIIFNLKLNMALTWFSLDDSEKAMATLDEAKVIAEKSENEEAIGLVHRNLAFFNHQSGKYEEAESSYQAAISMDRKLNKKNRLSTSLYNLGEFYSDWGEYRKSIPYLTESLSLKEELRKTARDELKRDYLAAQIHTYKSLVHSYLRVKDISNAVKIKELSSARYLSEQIGEKMASGVSGSSDGLNLDSLLSRLDDKTAVIMYANMDWVEGSVIILSKDKKDFVTVKTEKSLYEFMDKYRSRLRLLKRSKGGASARRPRPDELALPKAQNVMDEIINLYRYLLVDPMAGSDPALKEISRKLYEHLIKPIEPYIKGRKKIVIIPDGPLAILPFESLMDEKGRYMIAGYDIRYIPSLTVDEQLHQRTYPDNRKQLLAFGGAEYDPEAVPPEISLRSGSSYNLRDLGLGIWSALPGTKEEVAAIKVIIPASEVYTGEKVAESLVKELSQNNSLEKYRILHFATHGFVMPEVPELSSLVLSQTDGSRKTEDGYLTMQEISNLTLKSDIVVLSACETGLGKIYNGEGMVGLNQSFLIAGSNGVAVSLWQVSDEGTKEFMKCFYTHIASGKFNYAEALIKAKRDFITDKKYAAFNHPFYWAPFVYYGRAD
ncbi:MAG: CHAT domain-containing protein [Spirochaetales bacterium]|nr:CHAT domain-containing protein [Spirochaetales bacterium]